MINWTQKGRVEFLILFVVIVLAAFFRFYNLPEYMTFLGDEGRDAFAIKRILVEHDFPLLGPPTSVGNMYLGPLYYYMMAIPMAVFWLNPVAAAAMNVLIGVLTIGLIYYLSRIWFNKSAAVIAALLYAVSPVTIIYSRSSWNPNPTPFFTLLAIIGLVKVRQTKNFLWFILTGVSLAFALQMHYLALILLPIFFILWLVELMKRDKYRHFFSGTLGAIVSFCLLMSPLVIFDLRYNFLNYRAVTTLFTHSDSGVNLNLLSAVGNVLPIYANKLVGRYIAGENVWLGAAVSALIFATLYLAWIKRGQIKNQWAYFVLANWLVVGLLGLSFYRQEIYDHYLGFLNPVPFILLGSVTSFIKEKWRLGILGLLIILLLVTNLQKNPLLVQPNRQLSRTQEIARFVIAQSEGKPFNFALIAKNNYDSAYQFYLDQYGYKPKVVPIEVTDQLFVVCEDENCKPVGHPKYEIAGFGWTQIDWEKELDGVKVFKLVHNPADPNLKK